MKNTKSS